MLADWLVIYPRTVPRPSAVAHAPLVYREIMTPYVHRRPGPAKSDRNVAVFQKLRAVQPRSVVQLAQDRVRLLSDALFAPGCRHGTTECAVPDRNCCRNDPAGRSARSPRIRERVA